MNADNNTLENFTEWGRFERDVITGKKMNNVVNISTRDWYMLSNKGYRGIFKIRSATHYHGGGCTIKNIDAIERISQSGFPCRITISSSFRKKGERISERVEVTLRGFKANADRTGFVIDIEYPVLKKD